MRAAPLAMLLTLGACRGSAPTPSPEPPTSAEAEVAAADSKHDTRRDDGLTSEPTGGDADSVGWADISGPSACELTCADVYSCTLDEGAHPAVEVGVIEMHCLEACVAEREREPPLGCPRPESIDASTCAPFLTCVRASRAARAGSPGAVEPIEAFDGCAEACKAFARCFDAGTPREKMDQCASECREALDPAEQRVVGECARLSGCEDIMACVLEMPGA